MAEFVVERAVSRRRADAKRCEITIGREGTILGSESYWVNGKSGIAPPASSQQHEPMAHIKVERQ